jgi:hypothetical protein
MEALVRCEACGHGATAHEATGCTYPSCDCGKNLTRLVDEALESARNDIRREWHVSG